MSPTTRIFVFVLASAAFTQSMSGKNDRVHLTPQLLPGQKLAYLVSYQLDRTVKAQSRYKAPDQPEGKLTLQSVLHVEILDRKASGFRLRSQFSSSADPKSEAPGSTTQNAPAPSPGQKAAPPNWVEFVLANDGSVSSLTGLEKLAPVEQLAWREWIARFAAAMVYPKNGVKSGEKWDSDEPETAPSPIAGLAWKRNSQYVRDEPCPEATRTNAGDLADSTNKSETCAVILTTATLKQNSSPKDSTPEDYKLNHLKTSGTATGKNQTILYISRKTGLLMRSSESDQQSMDVTVALADASNEVHYNIVAESHARLLFLSATSPAGKP
jgi:hypothetical protein